MIINDKDLDVMYIRFFSFIFASIILISFIVHFFNKIYVVVPILFMLYIIFKEIKNAIILALPYEFCYCQEGIFYYKRILWKYIKICDFSLDIFNITEIKDRKKIEKYENENVLMYGIYYFSCMKERIKITTKDGKFFYLWVYNRQEDLVNFFEKSNEENRFNNKFILIKSMIEDEKRNENDSKKIKNLKQIYFSNFNERYNYILNKILEENNVYFFKNRIVTIINSDKEAITKLDIFRNIKFKEINFYVFYVNYLSKKEYENQKVLVGYNGIDAKEVTFGKLKEDINLIRDHKIND